MSCKKTLTSTLNVDVKDFLHTWVWKEKTFDLSNKKKKVQGTWINDLGKKFTIFTLLQYVLSIYHEQTKNKYSCS